MRKKLTRTELILTGDLSGLSGNVTGLSGDVDLCEITDADRANGVNVQDLFQ